MQRIATLLQKLNDLSKTDETKLSVIDLDLMLDYTRVLYADLLEMRSRVFFTESLIQEGGSQNIAENVPADPSIPTSTAPPVELNEIVENYEENTSNIQASATIKKKGDIRGIIGINDKYQFISELFGNNKEAYEDVLNNINNFETYQQAIEWMDEIHTQYAWDDEQFTVQSFYELLRVFFASR